MRDHQPNLISSIVDYFARSKITPLIIGFAIIIGLFAVLNIAREEEPQISVPMFDVFVSYPGSGSEEVERRIVNLGERKLWEIPGVEYIYSTSEPDGALIIVRFKVGEDVEKSLIKLYTKVYANLDVLPKGASQPLIKLRSIDDVPVLALTLHSSKRSALEIRKIAASLQNSIAALPDVSQTQITGGRRRQFQVFIDEGKLKERFLDPGQLVGFIRRANSKLDAGHLEGPAQPASVESDSFFRSKEDLENLALSVSQGSVVYLKDVARIVDGPDEDESAVTVRFGAAALALSKGPFDGVTLSVSKRRGANASALCEKILSMVDSLRGSMIPADVVTTVTRNYGATADEKSNELLIHMAIAVIGVSILIAIVLGLREAGVVAIAIPMTLALTLAAFYLFGFTLNRITLFALIFSIGILVDDPIVDVENIVRHMRMARNKGRPLLEVTIEAVNEVRGPLILATLTVIAAILPMAFVRGLMGPYMRPIPIGASAAMVFSMVVAFVATPWAAYRILGRAHQKGALKAHGESENEGMLTRLYRSYMGPLINNGRVRAIFLGVLAVLLLASVALVPLRLVKVKMLPFDNKNEFQVILDMPEGTAFEKTHAAIEELARYLATVSEVKDIETYVGTSAPYNFNGLVRHYFLRSRPYQADLQVNLAEKNRRKRQSHDIAKAVRPKVHEIVARYGGHVQVAEVPPGPPVLSTLVMEVYGPTLEGQTALTKRIEEIAGADRGVTDIGTYVQAQEKLLRLKVDLQKASLNGISSQEIVQTIALAIKGSVIDLAHLSGEYEPLEIIARLPKEKRASLDAVLATSFVSKSGSKVPLGELVTCLLYTSPSPRDGLLARMPSSA